MNGALSFKNASDFETPTQSGGTNNTYVVTVKLEDAGSLSDTHTVTVTDVNETPTITSGPATITKDENTPTTEIIATYVATDPDTTSGTMSWDLEGNDAGDFTITSTVNGTVNLYFAASPNFEGPADTGTDNVYDVTVRVRDNGSTRLQDTQGVTITVEDVNEAPKINGHPQPDFAEIEYDATTPDLTIGTYTYTDEDRNPADTITWRLSGTDAAHFNIGSSTGVLSFNLRPDFENPFGSDNEYVIVVEADDGQGGVGTFSVIVEVTNVDETPEITTTAASHTAPSFVEIEYDATTADLMIADYDGRDEEGQTISWSRTGTDAGDFTIDSGTGVLSFAQRPNFEMPADDGGDNVYNVTVRDSDTASPANVRELAVVVTVTDVNERPDIDENFNAPQTYMEIEYDFTGTPPEVHTFTATDYDAGDNVQWSLAGTDAAHLEIGAATGILTFKQDSCTNDGPLPDFEEPCDDNADGSSNTYSITVRATDDDATDQKFTDYDVVITVTDVNEAPDFTGTPDTAITLDEHDANTSYVVMDLADYDARDEEGGVTWSLTGTDRGDFAISADGVVTFAKTPNYEAPEDSGGDNVYEFTVVATDLESGSSRRNVTQAVTVTVGDVEEDGTLSVDNLSPAAGETLTFVLTDPDGGIDTTSMTWEIQSLASGGSWTRVSGVITPASATFPWTVDEDVTEKKLRAMVTYTDRRGSGKTALSQQTAQVTADPIVNAPPRFRGDSTWSVEEGPAGRTAGAPTSASDRDNDTLTYGIQSGLDAEFFEIDPDTGQVRLAQALDFETMSEPRILFFYLTLHDGRDADGNAETVPTIDATRSGNVAVVDVEEDGVVTLSTDEPEVEAALTATLEDGDGDVSGEAWQWARSQDGQTGWSNISGTTSSSYTTTQADAEFFLRATVTYADRRGDGKSADAITSQRVLGENQPPTFPSTEDGQRTIAENTPASANIGAPVAADDPENDALTYSLTGTDAAAFTIVETTGQLRVKDALDFETKARYSVTVEVHDRLDSVGDASTTVDDTQAVTITVENKEEQGVVTLTTNAETILARVEVVAALEDDDGSIANLTWQWARSPNGRTDWVNIQGATSAAYTPTLEEDAGEYIRATASYDDGHGPNKTAEKVSARVGAPAITVSRPTLSVDEGSMATYTVRLTFQPTTGVTVNVTGGGDVTVEPTSLTFTADNWDDAQTVTVTAAEDTDTADDAQTITHAVDSNSAPEYVGLSVDSVAVTVNDNDNDGPDVTVRFEYGAYSLAEGSSVIVRVRLSADPKRTVSIPLTGANQGGASSADYSGVPTSVNFPSGETEQSFTFTAARDAVEDDGESVKLGFGPLPVKVTAGTTNKATVSIADVGQVSGNRPPTVSARAEPVTVYAGDSVTLHAIATDLDGDALTYRWTSDGGGIFAPAATELQGAWAAPATETAYTANLTLTATDERGLSSSVTVSVLVVEPPQPNAVTDLQGTVSDDNSVLLDWTIPGQPRDVTIEGVQVQQRSGDGRLEAPTWDTVDTLAGPGTHMTVSGLAADTEYFFRVRLTSNHGLTADSRSLIVRTPRGAPAPRHFAARWATQTSITLIWSTVETAAEYRLEYRKDGETTWIRIVGDFDHLPSTSDSHQAFGVAAGLDCNTRYDFRLNVRGSGDTRNDGRRYPSNSFGSYAHTSALTGECAQEEQVTNLLVSIDPDCATLIWTPPSGDRDTGYRVQRYGSTGHETLVEQPNRVANWHKDCSDEYSTDGAKHSYIVTALDNDPGHDEEGAYGSAYTSRLVYGPGWEPEEGPRNVRLTSDTRFIRELAWDAPWDLWLSTVKTARAGSGPQQVVADPWVTGYRVERGEYRRTEDGGWVLRGDWETLRDETDGDAGTSFTDSEDKGDKQYVYRVWAYNAVGLNHNSLRGDWAFNGGDPGGYPEEASSNTSPTGLPTISGTPQVDQTLTASTSNIDDADGLTSATFEYQWIAGESDIDGATGASFTLTTSEQGQTIQVRVTFTDDADNEETLTSEATQAVEAATTPEVVTSASPLTGFTLLDTSGQPQTVLASPTDGDTLTLADPANGSYGIRVNTRSGAQIGSVRLQLSGAKTVDRTENWAPYTLYGDQGDSDLNGESLPVGSYTLTATAYSEGRLGGDEIGTLTVSFTVVAATTNIPARGLPTISGTPHVDGTLTADTSPITDTNGLANVSYNYQWMADGSDISGATGSSYILTSNEEGDTIQVRVSFTDDADNAESLTSAATVAVVAAPTPEVVVTPVALTASFSNVPSSHDGSSEFTFNLSFSENVVAGYARIRDDAFTISDGDNINQAGRVTQGSNQHWTIRVKPGGTGGVSITLPATTNCNATGAICTSGGKKLSNSLSITVSGPGG